MHPAFDGRGQKAVGISLHPWSCLSHLQHSSHTKTQISFILIFNAYELESYVIFASYIFKIYDIWIVIASQFTLRYMQIVRFVDVMINPSSVCKWFNWFSVLQPQTSGDTGHCRLPEAVLARIQPQKNRTLLFWRDWCWYGLSKKRYNVKYRSTCKQRHIDGHN